MLKPISKLLSSQQNKPLKNLLLIYELFFIALILLSVASGMYSIRIWDKASQDSQRIHILGQEIYQVRGDLYRQMKEFFDAFFLQDQEALHEHSAYTQSILKRFDSLHHVAKYQDEIKAIADIEQSYKTFINVSSAAFYRHQANPDSVSQKSIYKDIETGIFKQYETASQRAEILLKLKQTEIKDGLKQAKQQSIITLSLPLILAIALLFFSRHFLKRDVLNPIQDMMTATHAISTGNLTLTAREQGALELVVLSQAINKMAQDLSASSDALVHSEKQAALGLLIPMLAHNIRNPLASIRATAQMIDVPKHDKETQESLKGIILAVDRLERWTSSMLAYLHPIKPQLHQVMLSDVIQGVYTTLKPKLMDKSILFDHNCAVIKQAIRTDEHLLEQMLYNLILNALEASPQHTTIKLECSLTQEALTMTLTDQGTGMPFIPDPHATMPVPSTKRFGTGLGIPFAFKVCEELGANIQFASTGAGTKVIIMLPHSQS